MTKKYFIKRTFKESIEPEEILLDAEKSSEMAEQRIEVPIKQWVFKFFLCAVILGFLILVAQSFRLQIMNGAYYKSLAEKNRTRSIPIFASRGIIYDKSMKQLVFNSPCFDLVLNPLDLPHSLEDRQVVFKRVIDLAGFNREEIDGIFKNIDLKSFQPVLIAGNLEHEKVLKLEANLDQLPGFRIEKNITREYSDPFYFSHILGYMGKLGADEIRKNQDYFLTEKIGKNGLEFFYEKTLRGLPGEKLFEVDSLGDWKSQIVENQPQNGLNLVLFLDGDLQKKLYDSIGKVLQSNKLKKASAVAIDPKTGGILAMVSFPSFDNNIFAQGISTKDYTLLINDSAQPLFNRSVSGQYSPGSTIKPMIGAAALQEKVVLASTKINDPGELVLVNQYNPNIVYRFPDWKTHGIVDIYSAIAQSCDVYFYTIGGGYGNIKGLGIDNLEKYFKLFGMGEPLGVDFPGEANGLVPDPQWKESVKKEQWFTGDTYHLSIGQGDLLVTPLQLAAATASLANGGKLLAPRLVDKIIDSDKNVITQIVTPEILRENFIDPNYLSIIKKAMRQTVTGGSAILLNDLKINVAGKTGTAQVAGQKNSNAWFTAFAPYDNPQIALVILVEDAGEGSQISVPIAKDVLEWYFSK